MSAFGCRVAMLSHAYCHLLEVFELKSEKNVVFLFILCWLGLLVYV